jgi:hypothetical protein
VTNRPGAQKSARHVWSGWPDTSQAARLTLSITRTKAGTRSSVKGGEKANAGAMRRLTSSVATNWFV